MSKDLVMLSLHLDKVKEKDLSFPMIVTEKLDGIMCDLYRDADGEYHIRSRQGEPIPAVSHLINEGNIYGVTGHVLYPNEHIIGELYIRQPDLDKDEAFNKLSGKIRRKDEKFPECELWVFDIYDEIPTRANTDYFNRFDRIKEVCINTNTPKIKPVPYIACVNSLEELLNIYQSFMENNPKAEGIVARPMYGEVSHYKTGRSKGFIKLIPSPTVDLEIKQIIEAEGEQRGQAGKVICNYNGSDIQVGLGSLTHDVRADMWDNPSTYIDVVVEIAYKNETANGILRMPRVKRIRWDKTNKEK